MVFGRVIDGMLTLRKIENVATGANSRPKLVVKITGQWPSLILEGRLLKETGRMWRNVALSTNT